MCYIFLWIIIGKCSIHRLCHSLSWNFLWKGDYCGFSLCHGKSRCYSHHVQFRQFLLNQNISISVNAEEGNVVRKIKVVTIPKHQNRYSGQHGYNTGNLIEINIINNLSLKSTCKESFRIGLFNARSVRMRKEQK